jgi:thiamine biosynthesis lipoprotein
MATSAVGAARRSAFPGRIAAPAGAPATGVWTVMARRAWRADALTKVAACVPDAQRAAAVARLGGCLVVVPPEEAAA